MDKKPINFEAWLLEQGFKKRQFGSGTEYVKEGVVVDFDVEDYKIDDEIKKALDRNKTEFPEMAAASIGISTSADNSDEATELQEQLPFMIKEKFGGIIYDPQDSREIR